MYNKLFTSILDSSIWLESTPTRIVWVTFLAAMDETGFVRMATVENLAGRARVTFEEAEKAVVDLESPDKKCPEQEFEGRRIERVDGGWMVLNSAKYRDIVNRETEREQTRIRVARCRAKKAGNADVTVVTTGNEKVTPSEAASASAGVGTPSTATDLEIEPPRGFPRSEAEAVSSAEMAGVPGDFAATEYNRLLGRGYRDAKGVLITNWRGFIKACHNTSVSINAEKNGRRREPVENQI